MRLLLRLTLVLGTLLFAVTAFAAPKPIHNQGYEYNKGKRPITVNRQEPRHNYRQEKNRFDNNRVSFKQGVNNRNERVFQRPNARFNSGGNTIRNSRNQQTNNWRNPRQINGRDGRFERNDRNQQTNNWRNPRQINGRDGLFERNVRNQQTNNWRNPRNPNQRVGSSGQQGKMVRDRKPVSRVQGDLNGDGMFTLVDLAKMQADQSHLKKIDNRYRRNADMNHDGVVNDQDLEAMKRKIIELE